MVLACIGLGSNLADPLAQVHQAFDELADLPDSRFVARSPVYRSRPLGPSGQPDYINAVAAVETALSPRTLLARLQQIEHAHGRQRGGPRWGPRELDLDILLYGQLQQSGPELTIPHPELARRNFVVVPLHDILPALEVPGTGPVAGLRRQLDMTGLECLETLA